MAMTSIKGNVSFIRDNHANGNNGKMRCVTMGIVEHPNTMNASMSVNYTAKFFGANADDAMKQFAIGDFINVEGTVKEETWNGRTSNVIAPRGWKMLSSKAQRMSSAPKVTAKIELKPAAKVETKLSAAVEKACAVATVVDSDDVPW